MPDSWMTHSNPYDKHCKCRFWVTGKATWSPQNNTDHNPECPKHPLIRISTCDCQIVTYAAYDAYNNRVLYTQKDTDQCELHSGEEPLVQLDDENAIWSDDDSGRYWRKEIKK